MKLTQKLIAGLILVCIVLWIGHELKLYLPEVETWIAGQGILAPFAFILLFVVLAPIFVSIDALCFAAGVLFPIVTGEVTVIIATYLAAALIFYLGQDLFREKIQTIIAKHKRFALLDKVISGDNALKLMFLLRLTPLPFAMLSYALSVTQVKFWPYLVATSGILIYNSSLVYAGYLTKHLSGLIGGTTHKSVVSLPLLVFGLIALLAILIYAAKVAENALKELNLEN